MVEFLKIEGVKIDDLVITISSRGNGQNVVSVLDYCRQQSINSLAVYGLKQENKSVTIADYSIYVPLKTYGMFKCIHQTFLHLILDESMEIFEWDRSEVQNMNFKDYKL